MARIPSIVSSEKKDGKLFIKVAFTKDTDSADIVNRTFTFENGNDDNIKTNIQRARRYIEQVDTVGITTATADLSEPVFVEPTVAPVFAWLADYNRFTAANKLIAEGIMTGTEQKYLTLKQKVKDDFRIAYVDMLQ
jgi:hypothetical protein